MMHHARLLGPPRRRKDCHVHDRGNTRHGNEAWNNSAPHGAGRVMSRREARETLNLREYRTAMEGIYSTSVNERTIDEAPDAYKPIEDIIGPIAESVDIIDVMRPIYNFKAS